MIRLCFNTVNEKDVSEVIIRNIKTIIRFISIDFHGALQLKKSTAIYFRISYEMQLDGFFIEAQKIVCLKYANEQGYEVLDSHIYIDEAYSAKNEDRPEFKRLMIGAHSSEFSLIIIHRMDRFERNFRAMANTLEDISKIGVRVYSIYENLELANTLTVNLFGIINEHYIQNLSWETAKGKHQAAKEGYFTISFGALYR